MGNYSSTMTGFQGYHKFPHSVMGMGYKAPAPFDFSTRAATLERKYSAWLREEETSLPIGQKLRRSFGQLYRSKGEKYQTSDYYKASFTIETDRGVSVAKAG